jgi:hypothetical protein
MLIEKLLLSIAPEAMFGAGKIITAMYEERIHYSEKLPK